MSPSFTILIWVWVRVENFNGNRRGLEVNGGGIHPIPYLGRPHEFCTCSIWVSSQRKFKLVHWVHARTRLNKRILGYLGACARGPKEKKNKFRHWLSNCIVHPFFVGNYPYNYPCDLWVYNTSAIFAGQIMPNTHFTWLYPSNFCWCLEVEICWNISQWPLPFQEPKLQVPTP